MHNQIPIYRAVSRGTGNPSPTTQTTKRRTEVLLLFFVDMLLRNSIYLPNGKFDIWLRHSICCLTATMIDKNPCWGARCSPCRRSGCVAHRPRPLAQLAVSATGSARIAPHSRPQTYRVHQHISIAAGEYRKSRRDLYR